MLRRAGRTSRIVDESIQTLFTTGIVFVTDHHDSDDMHVRTFNLVLKRLKSEHQRDYDDLVIDKKKQAIALKDAPKSVWMVNEKQSYRKTYNREY